LQRVRVALEAGDDLTAHAAEDLDETREVALLAPPGLGHREVALPIAVPIAGPAGGGGELGTKRFRHSFVLHEYGKDEESTCREDHRTSVAARAAAGSGDRRE
jgi:hypothetical protein